MWVMANKAITKEARRAAREAAVAAQEDLARRTRANVEDLATFFSARERADAVDEWLAGRQQVLRERAAQRRSEQRVQCGRALRAMRDRGESLREIARMAVLSTASCSARSRSWEVASGGGVGLNRHRIAKMCVVANKAAGGAQARPADPHRIQKTR